MNHTMFLMLLVLAAVDLLVHPQEGSVSELSEVCVTVHNDSPPCERTPEADVSDLELDIDDPEESCTDHVSAYSTVELTARQRAKFTKMLRKPVSYCQPEGGTTTLKKLLNFKIMGEDGLVKYVRTALDHCELPYLRRDDVAEIVLVSCSAILKPGSNIIMSKEVSADCSICCVVPQIQSSRACDS